MPSLHLRLPFCLQVKPCLCYFHRKTRVSQPWALLSFHFFCCFRGMCTSAQARSRVAPLAESREATRRGFQPRHPRRICWSSGGLRRFSCRLLRRVRQPAAADLSGWSRANRPACRVPGFLLSFHCEEVAVGMAADSQRVCTWGWEACAS